MTWTSVEVTVEQVLARARRPASVATPLRKPPAVGTQRQQTIDQPQAPFSVTGHHAEPGVGRGRVRQLSDRFDTPRH
jgi:hypothetical protein